MTGWMDEALCATTDPAAFFPEAGENGRRAKAICGGCDVREQCLEYALKHHPLEGIWGGTSERERRQMVPVEPQSWHANLSVRQRQVDWPAVLSAYADRVPVSEIAARFGISDRSVYRIVKDSKDAA